MSQGPRLCTSISRSRNDTNLCGLPSWPAQRSARPQNLPSSRWKHGGPPLKTTCCQSIPAAALNKAVLLLLFAINLSAAPIITRRRGSSCLNCNANRPECALGIHPYPRWPVFQPRHCSCNRHLDPRRTVGHQQAPSDRLQSLHRRHRISRCLLGLVFAALSFSCCAAPIITRLETCSPTESTPPFLVYENVNGRWYANDSHGYPGPCVEVRLSWTTEPGKRYWVECGSNEQPKSGDTPTVRLNQWRRVSLDIAGDGQLAHWTNGVPWSWSVFRVGTL